MRGRFDDQIVDNLTSRGTTKLGTDATHSLAAFGVTPISQMVTLSLFAAISMVPVSISATQWGFGTSNQATSLIALLGQIRSTLVSYGFERGT